MIAELASCTVPRLFPELVEPSLDNDGLPSCSTVEALERQDGLHFNRQTPRHPHLALATFVAPRRKHTV